MQPLGSLRILILFRRTMVSFRRASQTKTVNVEKVQGLPRSSRRAISKELNIKIETVHVCRPLFAPVIPRSSSSLEYLLLSTIPVYPARGYPCSTFYSFTLLKKARKRKNTPRFFSNDKESQFTGLPVSPIIVHPSYLISHPDSF